MGADGFIEDIKKPVIVIISCHVCGKEIDYSDSGDIDKHRFCLDFAGELPIDIEITNFRRR
jgi:hypothetical protein